MRNIRKRQKTLSFKISDDADSSLSWIQLAMSNKLGRVVTRTDVIEEALLLLAKREKYVAKK